jgi:hypothetical protein
VGIPKFAEVGIRLCNLTAYRSPWPFDTRSETRLNFGIQD